MHLVDFMWSLFVIFFMVVYFLMLFRVIMDIFRDSSLSGVAKAIWLIAILVLPLITMFIYIVTRGAGMAKRDYEHVQAVQEAQNSYIRDVAGSTPADQIERAHGLLASGAITQAEFDALKAKALA